MLGMLFLLEKIAEKEEVLYVLNAEKNWNAAQNWMEMTMIGLLETESLIQLTIEYITIG